MNKVPHEAMRHYKRKTGRAYRTAETIYNAVQAHLVEGRSLADSAQLFGIPVRSLARYCQRARAAAAAPAVDNGEGAHSTDHFHVHQDPDSGEGSISSDSSDLPTMDVHQLILTIRKRPCLWNVADKNHFNRDLMHKHWLEVADEMGSSYEVVKKKWKGLKDVFRKEIKKTNTTKTPSSWSHFGDMEFMKEQMSTGARELPVPIETLFKTEMVEIDEEVEDNSNYAAPNNFILRNSLLGMDQISKDGEASSSEDGAGPSVETNNPTSASVAQPDSNTKPRCLKRRRHFASDDETPLPHLTYNNGTNSDLGVDLHKDDDYNFLVSFLPYLKTMDLKKKLLYRMKMCQLLYETAYQNNED